MNKDCAACTTAGKMCDGCMAKCKDAKTCDASKACTMNKDCAACTTAGKMCEDCTAKCKEKCKAAKGSDSKCSGGACKGSGSKDEAAGPMSEITPTALQSLLSMTSNIIVVDARGGDLSESERVPGAMQITADSSEEAIAEVVPGKDSVVVTYCGSFSCKASSKVAGRLRDLGYYNVIEMPAGIKGWKEANLDVEIGSL
ncbi:MAG: rhodanese-like domain-containing protein [Verrucomicrobia bacterium]|nr:rhodanese-like domain-containing protein [Verrucomicrobiota bacterium]